MSSTKENSNRREVIEDLDSFTTQFSNVIEDW